MPNDSGIPRILKILDFFWLLNSGFLTVRCFRLQHFWWSLSDHLPIFTNEWSQLIIISKINSSCASLTCQSRNGWTMKRRCQFFETLSFSYKLFTNIVTRFVAAIQSFYLYLVCRNCRNPIVYLLIPLFLLWKHFWKTASLLVCHKAIQIYFFMPCARVWILTLALNGSMKTYREQSFILSVIVFVMIPANEKLGRWG